MNPYRDLNLRAKVGLYLLIVLLLFSGYLGVTWWFLQQPSHHGPLLYLFLLGGFGVALFVITLLFVLIDRHVIDPLTRLEAEVRSIARGDLDAPISALDTADEIGTLSQSLHEMKDQLTMSVREAKQFEQAIEHAGHAIYITDVDGTIEYVNPAFEEITKYERDAIIGENPRILQSGSQSDSYYERLWETILDGDVWEEEFINQRATGELFHADQTIAPISDSDGELSGFVAIMADRTDQRVLEQQTQVLSRVLRHNIRTQCNLIDGYAQAALERDDPGERREYERKIRERVEKMVEVSSKADKTIRELGGNGQRRSYGVCTVADRVGEAIEDRYENARITLDLPACEIDVPVNLAVVLEEVVENAVEHNDRETPEVTISVSLTDAAGGVQSPTVRIVIEDNGPGIPKEERMVIEEGEETPLYHGSGLGLWLVYWRITLAGGDITIGERDPHGTRVSITLPRGSVSPFPRDVLDETPGPAAGTPSENDSTENDD